LTVFFGYCVRLSQAVEKKQVNREQIVSALTYQFLWHLPLLQDIARAIENRIRFLQSQSSKPVLVPAIVGAAANMSDLFASESNPGNAQRRQRQPG